MSSKRDDSLSKPYFGGKLVTGPDRAYLYLTLGLMYAPHVPFFALICPYFDDKMTAVVYVIPGYLVLFATVTLFCAASRTLVFFLVEDHNKKKIRSPWNRSHPWSRSFQ